MLSVFLTILPVFLILGVGYLVGRFKILSVEVADGLNAYALKIAAPVLLFLGMYRLDFSKAFHVEMIVSFYAGAFFCFYAGMYVSRRLWNRRPGESVAVGFCAVFSNTILIGLPIADLVFGKPVLTPVFGIIAFHSSLLYVLGMTTMEFSRRDGRKTSDTLKAAFSSIIANPLMIGILAGLAWNTTNIGLFEPIERALDMVRMTAIPVSLVGIGIALNRYSISSEFTETLMVCTLALCVHPAIAFMLTHYVFELDPIYVQAAVILAAMPPGMNVYIFAFLYKRALNLSASVLVIGNILAVFTIPVWILLIQGIG